jgi:hypothetical protein
MSGSLLTYLDILIGFVLVILLASSIVAVLSQWLLNLRNYRAVVLREGLKRLLSQVDGTLEPHADEIVQAILRHPLVAGRDWKGQEQDGRVIQREGLVRVLLELATTRTKLRKKAGEALRKALDLDPKDGDGPQATLDAIQTRAVQLEIEFPSAATHFLRARAIVENASGRLVSGLMSWFDETADRMTQYFAQRARAVTIALSAVVALALPLDAFDLLTRLRWMGPCAVAWWRRLRRSSERRRRRTPAIPRSGICATRWRTSRSYRPAGSGPMFRERQERRDVLPGGAGVVPVVRGAEAGDRGAGVGADRAP